MEKARLFGYRDYASYTLSNQMAKTPEAAADILPLLAARSEGMRLSLALPEEARTLLLAAGAIGFRAVSTRALLTERRRGDLRRYAGGGGRLF